MKRKGTTMAVKNNQKLQELIKTLEEDEISINPDFILPTDKNSNPLRWSQLHRLIRYFAAIDDVETQNFVIEITAILAQKNSDSAN